MYKKVLQKAVKLPAQITHPLTARNGQVTILFVVVFVFSLIAAAAAVDVGMVVIEKWKITTAADAAAIAGANLFLEDSSTNEKIKEKTQAYFLKQFYKDIPDPVSTSTLNEALDKIESDLSVTGLKNVYVIPDNYPESFTTESGIIINNKKKSITVHVSRTAENYFAKVFNVNTTNVVGYSVASVGYLTQYKGIKPFGIPYNYITSSPPPTSIAIYVKDTQSRPSESFCQLLDLSAPGDSKGSKDDKLVLTILRGDQIPISTGDTPTADSQQGVKDGLVSPALEQLIFDNNGYRIQGTTYDFLSCAETCCNCGATTNGSLGFDTHRHRLVLNADGTVSTSSCNIFIDDPERHVKEPNPCPRFFVMPVISGIKNGSFSTEIIGFATAFLHFPFDQVALYDILTSKNPDNQTLVLKDPVNGTFVDFKPVSEFTMDPNAPNFGTGSVLLTE